MIETTTGESNCSQGFAIWQNNGLRLQNTNHNRLTTFLPIKRSRFFMDNTVDPFRIDFLCWLLLTGWSWIVRMEISLIYLSEQSVFPFLYYLKQVLLYINILVFEFSDWFRRIPQFSCTTRYFLHVITMSFYRFLKAAIIHFTCRVMIFVSCGNMMSVSLKKVTRKLRRI